MSNQDLPKLLTVAQAAAASGLSQITIRRRIADGSLCAFRVGPRAIRIDRESFLHMVQGEPLGAA